jgi:hypothetical protein
MTIEKTGLSIEASSSGTSLILLPLEFSHCLKPSFQTPHPEAFKLLRLNVNLTGILFRETISGTLRFEYGPFADPRCRIDDWNDARRLKLAETDGWWPETRRGP